MALKRIRKLNKKRLLTITCVALLVYIGVVLIVQEDKLHALDAQKQEIRAQIEEIQDEGREYESAIEYAESEGYVEQEARDKLGMVKEGELQFIAKPQD